MAFTSVETIIHNPAKGRRNNVAQRKSLLQRLHFGSKAQRNAAKRALSGHRKKRKNTARSQHHKKRTAAKHRNAPARKAAARKQVHRPATKKAKRRSNPGEIISLALNSAKRRKSVASTHKNKKRTNAGSRPANRKPKQKHRPRRKNPGQIGGLLKTGLSVLGGAVGSKVGAQLVLGSKNTGIFGYLGNAAAGGLLAWGAKAMLHDRTISQGIIIGTVVQIIVRAVGDFTPYGSLLSGAGMGDYMVSNFVTPQRMVDGLNSAMVQVPAGWGAPALMPAPVGAGMSGMYDPLY